MVKGIILFIVGAAAISISIEIDAPLIRYCGLLVMCYGGISILTNGTKNQINGMQDNTRK